jgi:hypothetical protein
VKIAALIGGLDFLESKQVNVDHEEANFKITEPKITGKRKQGKQRSMNGLFKANQTATKASSLLKMDSIITPVIASKTITPFNLSPGNQSKLSAKHSSPTKLTKASP